MMTKRSNIENLLRSLDKGTLNRLWEKLYRNHKTPGLGGRYVYVSRKPQTRHEKLADLLSLPAEVFTQTATAIIERADKSLARMQKVYETESNDVEYGERFKRRYPNFIDWLTTDGDPRNASSVRYAREFLAEQGVK